jgi:hypothetical protein
VPPAKSSIRLTPFTGLKLKMSAPSKLKKRVNRAFGVAALIVFLVFLLFIFTSMGFFTFVKWSLILGVVGFLWDITGIGHVVGALADGVDFGGDGE